MLANHTSMAHILGGVRESFNNIYKKKAFLDGYRKQEMFKNNFDEFDESIEIIEKVVAEYNAMQRNDYLEWGEQNLNEDENMS